MMRVMLSGRLWAASLAIIATVITISCSDNPMSNESEYPDFTEASESKLSISLDQATSSKAQWSRDIPGPMTYDLGDCDLTVVLQAVGYRSAVPPEDELRDPPLEFAERIVNSDGVVQVIMIPVVSETDHALDVHIFVDTEWKDLVMGNAYLYKNPAPFEPGSNDDGPSIELDLSGDNPDYRLMTLTQPSLFDECKFAGSVILTNKSGDADDILSAAAGLDLEPGEVVVFLQPL